MENEIWYGVKKKIGKKMILTYCTADKTKATQHAKNFGGESIKVRVTEIEPIPIPT